MSHAGMIGGARPARDMRLLRSTHCENDVIRRPPFGIRVDDHSVVRYLYFVHAPVPPQLGEPVRFDRGLGVGVE